MELPVLVDIDAGTLQIFGALCAAIAFEFSIIVALAKFVFDLQNKRLIKGDEEREGILKSIHDAVKPLPDIIRGQGEILSSFKIWLERQGDQVYKSGPGRR